MYLSCSHFSICKVGLINCNIISFKQRALVGFSTNSCVGCMTSINGRKGKQELLNIDYGFQ